MEDIIETLTSTFKHGNWFLLIVAFVLVYANWGLEALKWKKLMRGSYPISLGTASKAVFTGNTFGIFTPNRVGGFIGRILYLPKNRRIEGSLNTFVGNIAQLLATLIFGVVGGLCVYLLDFQFSEVPDLEGWSIHNRPLLIVSVMLPIILVLVIVIFLPKLWLKILLKIPKLTRFKDKADAFAGHSKKLLLEVCLLSHLRYLVFATQLWLLLNYFGVNVPYVSAIILIGYLYLIITFVPTFMGKLGIRELFAIFLFGGFGGSESQIVFASLMLWMFNVILPALLGSVLLFSLKRKVVLE